MSFWEAMFGSKPDYYVSRAKMAQEYEREASEAKASAGRLEEGGSISAAIRRLEMAEQLYRLAAENFESASRAMMLRPLVPPREVFQRAVQELNLACRAVAEQKLLDIDANSEIGKAVEIRLTRAITALDSLVYESDITEEEFESRVHAALTRESGVTNGQEPKSEDV